MLFAVLPFVGYWATYRIKKLRNFLIISIALGFGLNLLVSVRKKPKKEQKEEISKEVRIVYLGVMDNDAAIVF